MTNPIVVEVTRGTLVESTHRGSVAIADVDGRIRFSVGDIDSPVYPRSSLKPVQALPLVESGAIEAFGLGPENIALACASHSAEPMHTTRIAAWLKRIGLSETDLACGPHEIRDEATRRDMTLRGEKPTRIHNNCSGKHTGFLTLARHWDVATQGYEHADHPVQQAVAGTLRELSGASELVVGVDGCTAPNFALPLAAFARALARLASPASLSQVRAQAAKRIFAAMTAHPDLVSGTGRACQILMRAAHGRAAVKSGAEGYFAGMVPHLGIGIAIKIDDGAIRGSETVIATILDRLGLIGDDPVARALAQGPVTNTRGVHVGERRPAVALAKIAL